MNESNCQLSLKTDNYYSFKTECGCYAHDLQVTFDRNKIDNNSTINQLIIYDTVYIGEDDDTKSIIKRIFKRIKCAIKCLFSDGFSIEHGFVFKSNEHIKEFIEYLINGYKTVVNNTKDEFYIIKSLPSDWYINDMSFKLVNNSLNLTNNRVISVKYKSDKEKKDCVITLKNEKGNKVELPINTIDIKNIDLMIEDIKNMINSSIKNTNSGE